MKKVIIVSFVFFIILFLNQKQYNISEDSIRFRVIANSDSAKDIMMKEIVVNELSSILFIDSSNKNEADENIYKNLNNIEQRINKIFENNNYNMNFNISYGLNEIPEKEYRGKVYPKGIYNSLVIEIGEAKGTNYFCILYPSLCMIDYQNSKKVEYKFRIKDIVENIF